jgi:hypothetical protein
MLVPLFNYNYPVAVELFPINLFASIVPVNVLLPARLVCTLVLSTNVKSFAGVIVSPLTDKEVIAFPVPVAVPILLTNDDEPNDGVIVSPLIDREVTTFPVPVAVPTLLTNV